MVWTIEKNLSLANTIIHLDFKASGCCYKKLVAFLVCMGSTGFSSGNVVEIKDSFHIKWQMNLIFDGRNITCPKLNTRECNDGSVVNCFQVQDRFKVRNSSKFRI